REVEAASRALPPAERAEMMGEIAQPKFGIEDFADVAAREGDRYQQNWFTKIDDLLEPITGKDRGLQKQVRNAWITASSYKARQGAALRHAVQDWTARSRRVLGLGTTGRKRGYARAVKVKEGAKIHPKLRQRVDHIRQHPEKYDVTPEQQAALDERGRMFEHQSNAELRHDVDVPRIEEETYEPWVISKTPKGDPLGIGKTPTGKRLPTTHPFFTHQRRFKDIEQLYAAGYETLDPLSAMQTRLEVGAETIANRQFVKEIQGLGYKASEKVDVALASKLKEAQAAHQAARKQALKTGSVNDRGLAEEAAVTLDIMGSQAERYYDVGIAGLHRLLDKLEAMQSARALVVVAGMEGALPSVVAGLVAAPVIAVPTSVGYGASFGGLAPLLTMLNSCAAGVGVVNIDNGFGAGYLAAVINRQSREGLRE
ncbi:hypothetical protein LCGC14_2156250, partial [marine sediment metagenome]